MKGRVESGDFDALSSGVGEDSTNGTRRRRAAADHPAPPELAPLLDVAGLARLLKVDRRYVYRLVGERRVPHLKCGHYVRFDPAEISRWLDGQRVAADAGDRRMIEPYVPTKGSARGHRPQGR